MHGNPRDEGAPTDEWSADELIPFGKYILLDRLSSGATASVYRAIARGQAGFERVVAIKRILPHMAGDPAFVKAFVAEAKTTARLTHANICPIYELGKVGESLYMAVEYVAGKDLGAITQRLAALGARVPPVHAAWIAARLCDALDYAHNLRNIAGEKIGIVHRDLSPTNIVISYEGQVKLIDFGLAKAVGKAQQTNVDALKKKLSYMSPEMVKGRAPDARSDIFGVGICFYEMLTGRRLFAGKNDIDTLKAVGSASVPPPSALSEDVPDQLELIVMRALEREPEDRWQDAAEMGDAINDYLQRAAPTFGLNALSAWMHELFDSEIESEQAAFRRLLEAGQDAEVVRQRRAFFSSPDGAAARARAEVERRLSSRPASDLPAGVARAPGPAPIPDEALPPPGRFEDQPTGFYEGAAATPAPFDEQPTQFRGETAGADDAPVLFDDEPTEHLDGSELEELSRGVLAPRTDFEEEPTEIFFNKEEGVGVRGLLDEINDVREERSGGGLNRPIIAPELEMPVPAAVFPAPSERPGLPSAPPAPAPAAPLPAPPTHAAPIAPAPLKGRRDPLEDALRRRGRGVSNNALLLGSAIALLIGVILVLVLKTPVGVALGLRAPSVGSIEIRTRPVAPAAVKLDGIFRGTAPLRIDRVKPGPREIRLEAPGYRPAEQSVEVKAGVTSRLEVPLQAAAGSSP